MCPISPNQKSRSRAFRRAVTAIPTRPSAHANFSTLPSVSDNPASRGLRFVFVSAGGLRLPMGYAGKLVMQDILQFLTEPGIRAESHFVE